MLAVDLRVQFGIVVHFELTVELEGFVAGADCIQKGVERVCEVGSLLLEDGEAVEVSGAMRGAGILAISLFRGVEKLESENGETVEHHARGLRVEGACMACGRGHDVFQQPLVDLFDEIISLLVEGVDGSLYGGDPGIGGGGVAGFVFFMPECEVGVVLTLHQIIETDGGSGGMVRFWRVPRSGPADLRGGEASHGRRLRGVRHLSRLYQ